MRRGQLMIVANLCRIAVFMGESLSPPCILYFTSEVFRHLANQNRGHIRVMLEFTIVIYLKIICHVRIGITPPKPWYTVCIILPWFEAINPSGEILPWFEASPSGFIT